MNMPQMTAFYLFAHVILLAMSTFLIREVVFAQSHQVETDCAIEITLQSTRDYMNPHRDVSLECEFTGPDGYVMKVAGFWDGGLTYRVRSALSVEGTWIYRTSCSDTSNAGLHGVHGKITVVRYTGTNPLLAKGWPKVSSNGHYLTYGDGEPWFYLGNTAWEITWKSHQDEAMQYISDRKRKGFSALQIVVMSHQRIEEFGVRNSQGNTFFLNNDFSLLNPRYFDYLDWIVKTANDSGIVVVLAPLWAWMNELHFDPKYIPFFLTNEQSLLLARYAGARYAGYNVMWIVAGDNWYDTPQQKAFWSEFAHTLRAANGNRQLVTLHAHGYGASFDYFDNNTDWLDFHMYQSSHVAGRLHLASWFGRL